MQKVKIQENKEVMHQFDRIPEIVSIYTRRGKIRREKRKNFIDAEEERGRE